MREIITRWQTATSLAKVAVMYFDETPDINAQRAAIDTFYEAITARFVDDVSWSIDTEGRVVDPQSGALSGTWSDPNALTGSFSTSGEAVADATQALVRWTTGSIVNGRRLYGRTFLPGLGAAQLENGDLADAARLTILTAAEALVGSGAGLGVWHRPTGGAGGSFTMATGAVVPTRLAVLRQRRN